MAGLGFTDDAAVMFAIYNRVKDDLDEETIIKAKEQRSKWFVEFYSYFAVILLAVVADVMSRNNYLCGADND